MLISTSKMTRKLRDRLAFAKYKAKHNLNSKSFDEIEAHLETNLKRRRTDSSVVSSSTSSSSPDADHHVYSGVLASSPMTAPVFSDDLYGSDDIMASRKRTRFQSAYMDPTTISHARKSKRTQSMAPPAYGSTRQSWKTMHNLPESSPLQHRLHPDFRTSNGPNISFASQASTIPNSPPFGAPSDDENDLPTHSFRVSTSNMRGSPPRTPPPTRSRGLRNRKGNAAGEEGADLLLYLATSPSPANAAAIARIFPPSTPPSNHMGFPNSLMATPGGTNVYTGFSTPGQQFNFADFVNVTPSPAQGAFCNRTPSLMKTPLAAKDTRRRLNFDSLVPPGGSPSVGHGGSSTGLGMELGGELVS
ncbi:hypothetical protein MMC13_000063 [Lambiella insularis]|nr:hypothetical protein [Lambiella insularis]